MPQRSTQGKNDYREILEQLKTWFPVPISNPILDGFFVHTISRFLDQLDSLKSAAPVLRTRTEGDSAIHPCKSWPEEMCSIEELTKLLADYCTGMPIWAHPNAQSNVVPLSSIPSIMAFMAAAIYNPNLVSDEYAGRFGRAEIEAVSLLSDVVGYDSRRSGGLFTFGGTGTVLYGCKLGIEKMYRGRAMAEGIRDDIKIVASESAHYTRFNVAGWLGLGTKNLVTIPTTRDNEISLGHFETYLKRAFAGGEKVAVILATMGTTDAFGIDDLASLVALRNDLAVKYGVEHPPHIHADSVIGWAWTVFRDYDFSQNPLDFQTRTLFSIQRALVRMKSLPLADSMGIDFHKTGYAPYVCSAFLCKDREDLTFLSREPEKMPYLYQFGNYHPGIYTLECSRSGASPMAALANLMLFGKRGFRVLIGHVVEMAERLRERLEGYPFIRVLNDNNYGPVTLFRLYPEGTEGKRIFEREFSEPDFRQRLLEQNEYNKRIFNIIYERAMAGEGILLSWTNAYRHAEYPDGPPIAAIKSYITSPWTDLDAVEMVVRQLLEARSQVE